MLFALLEPGVGYNQSSTRCKTYGAVIKVGGFIIIHIRIYIIMEFHLFLVSIITAESEVVTRIPNRGASMDAFRGNTTSSAAQKKISNYNKLQLYT